jgi:hypothetical protein
VGLAGMACGILPDAAETCRRARDANRVLKEIMVQSGGGEIKTDGGACHRWFKMRGFRMSLFSKVAVPSQRFDYFFLNYCAQLEQHRAGTEVNRARDRGFESCPLQR